MCGLHRPTSPAADNDQPGSDVPHAALRRPAPASERSGPSPDAMRRYSIILLAARWHHRAEPGGATHNTDERPMS